MGRGFRTIDLGDAPFREEGLRCVYIRVRSRPRGGGSKLSDVLQRLRGASPGVTGRPRWSRSTAAAAPGNPPSSNGYGLVPASGVVHTDDIAWNHACFDWGGPMVESILRPLHRGEGVVFRPPAWIEHDRPGAIPIPAAIDIVRVEGAGVIREEFAQWIDASIWMQGDLDEQESRLVARDGDSPAQQDHIARWLKEELPLMLREQPWKKRQSSCPAPLNSTTTQKPRSSSLLPHVPESAVLGRALPTTFQVMAGEVDRSTFELVFSDDFTGDVWTPPAGSIITYRTGPRRGAPRPAMP